MLPGEERKTRSGGEMTKKRLKVGRTGEELASRFLVSRGMKVLAANYRLPIGEIDILAEEGDILVIVEVKTKTNASYGLAKEEVDWRKQRKLKNLARALSVKYSDRPIRIDVIGIDYQDGVPKIEYIPNAVEG